MSNTRQIQPKVIWTPQGEKTITIFAISNLSEYHFDNSAAKIEYKLIYMKDNGVQTIINEDGSVTTVPLPQSAEELITDTLLIPASIIQQWGTDDDIIFEYATETLGFILI